MLTRLGSVAVAALAGAGAALGGWASAAPPLAQGDCSAAAVQGAVRSLVRAFNAGNTRAVDRVVAPEPDFQWFSAPGTRRDARRLGADAFDRSTLDDYVRTRHAHRERLTLHRVSTTDHARGNFGLVLTREADDYPRRTIGGKGAARCTGERARVIVWSLGSEITP